MKKVVPLGFIVFFIIFFLGSCVSEKAEVKKIIENGVEIVINNLKPYKKGEKVPTFSLQEEFSINMDSIDLVEKGFTEVHSFDVDSEGNIYVVCVNNDGNLIYKFDNNGSFVKSFARSGQGPGEFVYCSYFRINSRDELIVTGNFKIIIFDKDGNYLREIKITLGSTSGTMLENGNYLFKDSPRPKKEKSGEMICSLSLYDPEFNKIKELDKIRYPDPGFQEIKGIYYKILWSIENDRIFTASQERDYEIYIYDFNGNLLRKIRKKYQKISPSDEYKAKYKENLGENMYQFLKDRLSFPSFLPPFHFLLTDDEGKMFAMTYEKGEKPDEHVYDVFDPEGVFILRKSMKTCLSNDFLSFSAVDFVDGKIKNSRFYCHYEKEDSSTELIIYKISWTNL
jgi:hypothetical protein